MHYVITCAMGGYLPEAEPYVFSTDPQLPAMPQVLEVLKDEIERMADQDVTGIEPDEAMERAGQRWDAVLDEVEEDRNNACDLSEDGAIYWLPNGYHLQATRYSEAELTTLGYVPGKDFEPEHSNA